MSFKRPAKAEDCAISLGSKRKISIMEVIGLDGQVLGRLVNGGTEKKKKGYQMLNEVATI